MSNNFFIYNLKYLKFILPNNAELYSLYTGHARDIFHSKQMRVAFMQSILFNKYYAFRLFLFTLFVTYMFLKYSFYLITFMN